MAADESGYAALYQAAPTSTAQLSWNTNGSLPLVLSDGTNDYIYGPSTSPVEQISLASSAPTYLTYTASDGTWLSTNEAGDETGFWGYDAFGNLAFGNPTSPFGYSGQYTDTTTSLVNDEARWYEPQTGEFTSRDPDFASTDTAYTYAGDDPVNASDPTGDITCGSIIPVGCGVVTDVQNGVSGAAQAVGSFVYRYSGDIATVSSILAAVTIEVPGVGEVFGAVAVAAGALSTERDIVVEHNLAAAVLDAAGTIAGGGSLGAEGLGSLLDQASHDATTLGPVADWLSQDAASKYTLSRFLSRYGAAIAAGSFSLNQLLQLISKSNGTAGASTVANNCGY